MKRLMTGWRLATVNQTPPWLQAYVWSIIEQKGCSLSLTATASYLAELRVVVPSRWRHNTVECPFRAIIQIHGIGSRSRSQSRSRTRSRATRAWEDHKAFVTVHAGCVAASIPAAWKAWPFVRAFVSYDFDCNVMPCCYTVSVTPKSYGVPDISVHPYNGNHAHRVVYAVARHPELTNLNYDMTMRVDGAITMSEHRGRTDVPPTDPRSWQPSTLHLLRHHNLLLLSMWPPIVAWGEHDTHHGSDPKLVLAVPYAHAHAHAGRRMLFNDGTTAGDYVRLNKLKHHRKYAVYPEFVHSVASFTIADDAAASKRRDEATVILRGLHLAELVRRTSAVRIQRAWRRAIADPGRAVCRKRLLREFGLVQGNSGTPPIRM